MAARPTSPLLLGVCLACALLAGCALPEQEAGFESSDPQARLLALQRAAASGDTSRIPEIIGMLESDDPGIRMLANATLERMTGESAGYDHAAREHERRAAIDRWEAWWRSNEGDPAPARTMSGTRP
ncbi:MAG: hypothetical protein EA379_11140 [Phycisphaerales bacterium]|nr:MAG: hypothetical protein EA379_11140 [Phycisphaerales bacterium]